MKKIRLMTLLSLFSAFTSFVPTSYSMKEQENSEEEINQNIHIIENDESVESVENKQNGSGLHNYVNGYYENNNKLKQKIINPNMTNEDEEYINTENLKMSTLCGVGVVGGLAILGGGYWGLIKYLKNKAIKRQQQLKVSNENLQKNIKEADISEVKT